MAELALVARNDMPIEARKAAPAPDAPIVETPAAPDAPAPKKRRGRLIGGIGGLLLIAGGALAYQYETVWSHQESTDNAYVRADITPVAAKVDGYVAKLLVDDNQPVKAGDVIAVIEPADYQARVAKAEADLAAARANLGTASAARGSAAAQAGAQGEAIAQASARVAAARAAASKAAADEGRFAQLAGKGWVTKAQMDQVRAAAAASRADVAAAQAAVAAQRGQASAAGETAVGASAAIAAARAQVQAAEAAVRAAQLDLSRTVIRAPVDGVVGNRAVRVGQLVKSGQQLLAIVPVQTSYVVANFKETQLQKMHVGQRVDIRIDAYPHVRIAGRIDSLAPASGAQFALIPTDSASGNFTKIVQRVPIKIAVAKSGLGAQLLRPGLSVVATVDTRS